eukprot:gene2996-3269_t
MTCKTSMMQPVRSSWGMMRSSSASPASSKSRLALSSQPPALDEETRKKIEELVTNNQVVLFMKGTKEQPQCGFSSTAARILEILKVPYRDVNVFEDDRIRNGIKIYSSWPTIPQLYVRGEFIGGSDIMVQLFNSGELAEMLEVAAAE